MKVHRRVSFQIACVLFILFDSGCENPYRKNYLSTVEKWPGGVSQRLLKPQGSPRLVTSGNIKKDVQSMLESGYVLLGRAKFRDRKLDESLAIEQAQSVGAWVVLVESKYVNTVTESVPFGQWTPDQTTVTTEDTQIQHDPRKAPVVIQKQTVQTVQGEYQTTFVPQNVDYYDYSATFWAKTKKPMIGVLVQSLTDELKKTLETNKGVVVKAVVRDSPAFNADVLKDDVLMRLAGEEIRSPEQFFDIVSRNAGTKVFLDLFRNGRDVQIQLILNKDE